MTSAGNVHPHVGSSDDALLPVVRAGRDAFARAVSRALTRPRHGAVAVISVGLALAPATGAGRARVIDELIARFTGAVRGIDVVSRVGRERFAVLCSNLDGPTAAVGVAARVLDALVDPLLIDGVAYRLAASVGVATEATDPDGDTGDESGEELLARAEEAMELARLDQVGETRVGVAPAPHATVPGRRPRGGERSAVETDFADFVVRRLHEVGLVIASCSGQLSGPLAARLAGAADELDAVIRETRTFVLDLLADSTDPPV